MSPPTNDGRVVLPATREEAWVAHAALLDAGEAAADAGDDAPPQLRPVRGIERGRPLHPDEVVLLRDALVDYLGDAPVRDRAPGRAVLRRADDSIDDPSDAPPRERT